MAAAAHLLGPDSTTTGVNRSLAEVYLVSTALRTTVVLRRRPETIGVILRLAGIAAADCDDSLRDLESATLMNCAFTERGFEGAPWSVP